MNRLLVPASPSYIPGVWSPWFQSPGYFATNYHSSKLKFDTVSETQSSFAVEVQYYKDGKWHTDNRCA